MKTLPLVIGLALAVALPASAEETNDANPAAAALAPHFDAGQLDQLLGPVALYPDALIALILPAATNSSDIVLAARYLASGGDAAQVDNQPWDDSVRALTHYPEVIRWMDQNLAWTKQVGDAFAAQPTDVMNAVQRLRAKARAAGTLTDTPQQQVVTDDNAIAIVPTQPDVIYVPYYDPEVVYVPHDEFYGYPYFTFGAPYATGFWLSFNLDWRHHRVWAVNHNDRERFWRERRDYWRHPTFPDRVLPSTTPNHYVWTPRPVTHVRNTPTPQTAVVRPAPFAGVQRFRANPAETAQPNPSLPLSNPLPQPLSNPLPRRMANPTPAPAPTATTTPTPTTPAPAYVHNVPHNYYREYHAPPAGYTAPAYTPPPTYRSAPPAATTWRAPAPAPQPQAAPAPAPAPATTTPAAQPARGGDDHRRPDR